MSVRWEYRFLVGRGLRSRLYDSDGVDYGPFTEALLNRLSAEGWEVVSHNFAAESQPSLILRRRPEDEDDDDWEAVRSVRSAAEGPSPRASDRPREPSGFEAVPSPWLGPGDRRVIRTARSVEAINAAAREGFRPLVKPVRPGQDIHHMVAVFQDPETGVVELSGDVRGGGRGEMVMDYTLYYPYHFPSPFAAYLVPTDIARGEEVWLEDLIEDLVAVRGNQGYHPRLPAAPAVWNGSDFEIRFDPERDAQEWLG